MASLFYEFWRALLLLEPLVMLGGQVYGKTRQRGGPASLVTALDVEHPLRTLCSERVLVEHYTRINRDLVRQLLEPKVREPAEETWAAPLACFFQLIQAIGSFDWGSSAPTDGSHHGAEHPTNLDEAIEGAARSLPVPELRAPSLLVLGRVWTLSESAYAPGRVSVRLGEKRLGLTGCVLPVQELMATWQGRVQEFLSRASDEVVEKIRSSRRGADVSAAIRVVNHQGYFQYGDYLFLAGSPARLGYILPPHHNTALGREVDRDVAITSVFDVPPSVFDVRVYECPKGGRWQPVANPSFGICFGGGIPQFNPTTPGLSVATYLRWAAIRAAKNGKFHA